MGKKIYTKEHIEYLRKIAPGRYNDEITAMFNKKFNMNVTESAIRTLKVKNKILSNVSRSRMEYTQEQLDYLKKLSKKGLFNSEITKKFNERFGTNKSESAIKNQRAKYKMHTSARNYWPKGHEPWNKGKKGFMGPNKTSFKKGHKPHNWVPIGSERITKDGYIEIKIQEGKFQKNWRGKHILVWEEHNGPVPEGHAVIFGDGNNRNFDLDNLILVSRAQLLKLNQQGLIKNDADLTRTGVIIADLQMKISERSK